jgi:sulfite reductase (NADPH) flavoprotein alpha-component
MNATMQHQAVVPYIPETAPFSEEQRQWLNGFMAGLFSTASAAGTTAQASAPASQPAPPKPLLIMFGSQTGNAEGLAKKLTAEAGKRGFAPTLSDLAKYDAHDLQK